MSSREGWTARFSSFLPIVGGALSAPLIGMIFEAMIRHGWLGLDQVYAVYPISTIALAALISVVPLAVIVTRFIDHL